MLNSDMVLSFCQATQGTPLSVWGGVGGCRGDPVGRPLSPLRFAVYYLLKTSPLIIVCLVLHTSRILPIKLPLQGVVQDVFTGTVQFILISDDVLVIVPLPDREIRRPAHFIDFFGGSRFK